MSGEPNVKYETKWVLNTSKLTCIEVHANFVVILFLNNFR